jgi:hypothetical protein
MQLGSDASKPKNPHDTTVKSHPPVTNAHKPPVVAAADEKDPKALAKQAGAAEAANDWDTARTAYAKLEKFKAYQPAAVYGQAYAAFQLNDTPNALALSQKAIKISSGPLHNKAFLLYADTIFKQGDAKRAKDNYINLRSSLSDKDKDLKATVTKKIATCNRQLGHPERDGIKGD